MSWSSHAAEMGAAEHAVNSDAHAMTTGVPLADFECPHGRIHGDRTPTCGCWPGEAEEFRPVSLLRRVANEEIEGYTCGMEPEKEAAA